MKTKSKPAPTLKSDDRPEPTREGDKSGTKTFRRSEFSVLNHRSLFRERRAGEPA